MKGKGAPAFTVVGAAIGVTRDDGAKIGSRTEFEAHLAVVSILVVRKELILELVVAALGTGVFNILNCQT